MNYIFTIIDVFGIAFELYIVLTFFDLLLGNQEILRRKKIIVCSIYFVVLFAGVNLIFLKSYIPLIAYFATLIIAYMYNSKLSLKITYSALIFSMLLTSEVLVGLVLNMIFKINIKTIQITVFYYFAAVILSKFILFIVLKIIATFIKNKDNSMRTKKIALISILPLSSAYIIYLLFIITYKLGNKLTTVLAILGASLLLLANILVIYFIEKISEIEITKQKLVFAENQLSKQANYYNEIIDNQIKIAKIYHDMNNSFISILGYFNTKDYNKAENKIKLIIDDFIEPSHTIVCSNSCIGALLTVKNEKANKENIKFDFRLNLPSKIYIDEIDLCIIIGNALDNAIEACQQIEDFNKRYILFQISDKDEYISIYIKNSVFNIVELNTKKDNKLLHGYGILNIKSLCEKYNGNVIFEQNEDFFETCILIKNSKK